jgi:hypothetical protein
MNIHTQLRAKGRTLVLGRRAAWLVLLALSVAVATTGVHAQDGPQGQDQPEVILREQITTPSGINSVIEIPVAKDSLLASGLPDNNFGTSFTLNLGYDASGTNASRMLLQFNLGAIPSNAVINSAQFQIYQHDVRPAGDAPMGFQAQYMRADWNETEVTWNNANYLGGTPLPIGEVDSALGWKYTNATDVVRAWHSGAQSNHGVIITGDERPEQNRLRRFYSREQAGFYPRLIVDYTVSCDNLPPVASANPLPQFSPGSFTVTWSGFDQAPSGCAPSGIAYYDVQYRINGGGWAAWLNQTNATSATFNSGANGAFVEFRVRAVDIAGNAQGFGGTQASTQVDTQPPAASMNALPEFTISSSFVLTWGGTDNLSGIAAFDVQFREVGGDWQWLVQNTAQTSYQVTGAQNGVTYELRARAADRVGNVQPWSETPQARTTVFYHPVAVVLPFNPPILKPTAPVTTSFTVNWGGFFAPGTSISSYEIWYNYNNTGWQLWNTFPGSQTFATFDYVGLGHGDGPYQFEAVATNNLNQKEPRNSRAEATLIVDIADQIQPSIYMPIISNSGNYSR